ncbi:hypothetical protein ACG0Z5_11620 [Scandinavium sp. M-37]|jgi:hypothetical protein|uniref:hypothetical protein n=1 Tax=Scandinavium sp. M-37 TaxID=3373077 RepID=UPI003746F09F
MNILSNDIKHFIETPLFSVLIILMLCLVFFRLYNKIMYKRIKAAFLNRFDIFPSNLSRYENASLVCSASYFGCVLPMMRLLILPYNKKRGVEELQVNFIKGLPTSMTIGFKVEALLWMLLTPVIMLFILIQ